MLPVFALFLRALKFIFSSSHGKLFFLFKLSIALRKCKNCKIPQTSQVQLKN